MEASGDTLYILSLLEEPAEDELQLQHCPESCSDVLQLRRTLTGVNATDETGVCGHEERLKPELSVRVSMRGHMSSRALSV